MAIVLLVILLPSQGILVGCLFFYSGFLFAHIEVRQRFWFKFSFIVFFSSFLVVALFSQEYFSLSNGVSEILFSYLLVASLTFPLLVFRSIPRGVITKLTERSYSLYAVHFPVITGVESLWFQSTDYLTVNQFLITLFLVMFSTELAFQLIEKPSIRQSRRILTRKSSRRSISQ